MTTQTHRSPQEKICAYEYTVRRGDSFYLIANRLGVPLRDLLAANANINPARLMVGDVLCIPTEEDDAPAPPAPQPEPSPAPVVPDEEPPVENEPDLPDELDDLDQPAQSPDEFPLPCTEGMQHTVQQNETIADIQLENDLNLHTLQSANPETDLEHLSAGQVLCIPEANVPCPAAATMLLSSGDTLESLALKLNTSMGALLRANPCLAPGDFVGGVCIHLPE